MPQTDEAGGRSALTDAARTLFGPALIHEYLTGRPPLWSLHGGVLLAHQTGQVKDPGTAPGLVAPLTRTVFERNHDTVMRWGGEGLARRLGAPLLAAG